MSWDLFKKKLLVGCWSYWASSTLISTIEVNRLYFRLALFCKQQEKCSIHIDSVPTCSVRIWRFCLCYFFAFGIWSRKFHPRAQNFPSDAGLEPTPTWYNLALRIFSITIGIARDFKSWRILDWELEGRNLVRVLKICLSKTKDGRYVVQLNTNYKTHKIWKWPQSLHIRDVHVMGHPSSSVQKRFD